MKKVICIIDDDLIYQYLMSKIITTSKTNCDLTSFKNGYDAIESFKSTISNDIKLPEIIFLDIEMPLMNGWDFMNEMEKIIAENKLNSTKIYIVSSSISYEDIEKSKLFKNINGYFSKPLKLEEIQKLLANDL